jgi:hypothetical protein
VRKATTINYLQRSTLCEGSELEVEIEGVVAQRG